MLVGASAVKLLVRNRSLVPRAVSGSAEDGACNPPAAGWISRFHAPQFFIESTYAVSVVAKSVLAKQDDAVASKMRETKPVENGFADNLL